MTATDLLCVQASAARTSWPQLQKTSLQHQFRPSRLHCFSSLRSTTQVPSLSRSFSRILITFSTTLIMLKYASWLPLFLWSSLINLRSPFFRACSNFWILEPTLITDHLWNIPSSPEKKNGLYVRGFRKWDRNALTVEGHRYLARQLCTSTVEGKLLVASRMPTML
jgi:hypothetical protein